MSTREGTSAGLAEGRSGGTEPSSGLYVSEGRTDLLLLSWNRARRGNLIAQAEQVYGDIDEVLREQGAVPLQERIFGSLAAAPCVALGRSRALARSDDRWAVAPTFIEGLPADGGEIGGIHIIAARAHGSSAPRVLVDNGVACGRTVETRSATFLGLTDVGRVVTRRLPMGAGEEVDATLGAMERLLAREGFSFADVPRTWFYLRDILEWYGPFNAVRNAAFRRMRLSPDGPPESAAIPASTGIGGCNTRGSFCALDAIAARPRADRPFEMRRLRNLRQNEATDYGSAFARGVALTSGDTRYLFISGTASIDEKGDTVHVGDFEAQVRRTIENVASLLTSAGSSLEAVCQATVFIKEAADCAAFAEIVRSTPLADAPLISVIADVCRDDLLFEIDATAIAHGRPSL